MAQAESTSLGCPLTCRLTRWHAFFGGRSGLRTGSTSHRTSLLGRVHPWTRPQIFGNLKLKAQTLLSPGAGTEHRARSEQYTRWICVVDQAKLAQVRAPVAVARYSSATLRKAKSLAQ